MPTAARGLGAVGMAATAAVAASVATGHLDAGTDHPGFVWVCAAMGLALGWRSIGSAAGKGWGSAVRAGLRAAMYLAVLAIAYLGGVAMLMRAVRLRYHGPFEALTDVFGQCFDIGRQLYQLDLIGVLFLGGALSAIVAEWASRHWR
ncbi:TrgA family protein [Paenirhodobacter enshiensis]|uniref:Tellurium resistance protein n=1 Tax=Paenirhodobacter enshiensis TaxID=1105367 RepID=A0A086Y1U9_9RHOB|nr:TrgA family protein [Paenirhodobacter enshiensis]KFI28249.1 hypothetical protein CG50_15305 [Paenirhodobacter enshiensis]